MNQTVVATDATTVTVNGKQNYTPQYLYSSNIPEIGDRATEDFVHYDSTLVILHLHIWRHMF